jgi:hypothetical protein
MATEKRGFMTMNIDFAHAGKCIAIALPADMRLSVHDALTSLEMGLQPLRELSGKVAVGAAPSIYGTGRATRINGKCSIVS